MRDNRHPQTALPPSRRGAVLFWLDTIVGHPVDAILPILEEMALRYTPVGFVLPDETAEVEAWARALGERLPSFIPRGEALPLRTPDGATALLDRALFRPLGLPTLCVRLWIICGDPEAPRFLLARRSPSKRIGPGLWDSPVGGLLARHETEFEALAREAYEEAGLCLTPESVQKGPVGEVDHFVPEGRLVERTANFIFSSTEIPRLTPVDGEVSTFAIFTREEVERLAQENAFFPDALTAWRQCFPTNLRT